MKKSYSTCTLFAVIFLLSGALFLQLPGCGGGGGGGGGSESTGTLQVGITDSPAFPDFLSVHITIVKVVAVPAGREGLTDDDPGLPVIATFPAGLGVDILTSISCRRFWGALRSRPAATIRSG
jgi:hypothetical protein